MAKTMIIFKFLTCILQNHSFTLLVLFTALPVHAQQYRIHVTIRYGSTGETLSGEPLGAQHITENHANNGTSLTLGGTFFYPNFVPNGDWCFCVFVQN